MTKPGKPKIPQGIAGDAARWYRSCIEAYRLHHPGELATLAEAARCLTRIAECQKAIKRDGICITGSRGTVTHPALRAEQQARGLFLQAVRQLGLSQAMEVGD